MTGVKRLCEVAEYVEALAKLVERPHLRGSQYKHLFLRDLEFASLPGITFNPSELEGGWLQLDRLVSGAPPEPPRDLRPWISISADPSKELSIRDHIGLSITPDEARKFIALGRLKQEDVLETDPDGSDDGKVQVLLRLTAFPEIKAAIQKYASGPWSLWSTSEKKVNKAKAIYDKFFVLYQAIASGTLQKPLEILWGIGVLSWMHPEVGLVDHPLIEIPVELSVDQQSAAICIRTVGRAPRIAEGLVSSLGGDGSTTFLLSAKAVLDGHLQAGRLLSPFDRASYEQLLRLAAAEIDANGEFRAEVKANGSGRGSEPEDHLVVSDAWAIYARPRSENYLIQDLRKQREAIKSKQAAGEPLPGFAKRIVRDESADTPPQTIPGGRPPDPPTRTATFFLPQAFNDDQIAILTKLDLHDQDGAVVQGPPGTGKTHTIANIICHYIATGRRVLVTSHSEGALAVLRDQIPESVRKLADRPPSSGPTAMLV